jgi:hypothetical protein
VYWVEIEPAFTPVIVKKARGMELPEFLGRFKASHGVYVRGLEELVTECMFSDALKEHAEKRITGRER